MKTQKVLRKLPSRTPKHNSKENLQRKTNAKTVLKHSEAAVPMSQVSPGKWSSSSYCYRDSLSSSSELEYMPQPLALEKCQPHITPSMRGILLDWMMEVCSELTLKRETFYLAANHLDRVLCFSPNIAKTEFQLIGLTVMCIAAKTEEICTPRLEDWAQSADCGYSVLEIRHMEQRLLRCLNWKIFPLTAFSWLNWLMSEWDSFVEYHFGCVRYNDLEDIAGLPVATREKQKKAFFNRFIVFKHSNEVAYRRYRETLQILDVVCLHIDVLMYTPKELAVSLLNLMLEKYFRVNSYVLLHFNGKLGESPRSEHCDNALIVQDLFCEFIRAAAQVTSLDAFSECIEFLHCFLDLKVVYGLPIVCRYKKKSKLESHYEDFLGYQTHNPHNLPYLSERVLIS